MSMPITTDPDPAASAAPGAEPMAQPERPARRLGLGLHRFSGLYVWAIIIAIFAMWIPDLFLSMDVPRNIASDQAITCMLAFGLLFPLAAGVFDLSFAATMGFILCTMSRLLAGGHVNVPTAIAIGLVIGLLVGTVNGFLIVALRIDSFIATLGTSTLLAGLSYWVTGGVQQILPADTSLLSFGAFKILGIPMPFWAMIVFGVLVYVIIEHTPTGRVLFAVGGNPNAARLAGVRVDRVVFGTLVACSLTAAIGAILLTARLGVGSYDVGPAYLLPAFSAVFLGSTQIRPGRVNVIGTFVGIYLLATGVKGLQLAGTATYVNDLFNGFALLIAVALAARTRRNQEAS
jgi:ribose transport system permease protein